MSKLWHFSLGWVKSQDMLGIYSRFLNPLCLRELSWLSYGTLPPLSRFEEQLALLVGSNAGDVGRDV